MAGFETTTQARKKDNFAQMLMNGNYKNGEKTSNPFEKSY